MMKYELGISHEERVIFESARRKQTNDGLVREAFAAGGRDCGICA